MKRYTIKTLGCKVNQCESSALAGLLEASGYRHTESNRTNDLIIINTCTVTAKAAMQSRQAIRQAIRHNPQAKIVVTGCYAQTAPGEIQTIEGVEYIVGHADKLTIARILEKVAPPENGPAVIHRSIHRVHCFDPMPTVAPESRTRAFLKIQDGCDAYCTYCIVPHARGRSRSMPIDDAVDHIELLAGRQYKEVVLTGIHLGAYGRDLRPKTSLYQLIDAIHRNKRMNRIRISSIEPTEIDSKLVEIMADAESPLCPHFHIPLQSGDNNILKRMGRPYNRSMFRATIDEIRTKLPSAAIGVDILVGFPGEDDGAYDRTYSLIESLDVTYLHVFPFSPRKGTPAALFKEKVPEHVVKERCRNLRRLGEKKKAAFNKSNIHRKVSVLIEKCDEKTGDAKGMSENYIHITLPESKAKANSIVEARIQSIDADNTVIAKLLT